MSTINDIPRQELCKLVSTYGRNLCDDPQRCEALLRDYCGSFRREISLLINAQKEQIPGDLLSSEGKVPFEILRDRLVKKLEENLSITETAAQWAVDAWAAALELSPGHQLAKTSFEQPKLTLEDIERYQRQQQLQEQPQGDPLGSPSASSETPDRANAETLIRPESSPPGGQETPTRATEIAGRGSAETLIRSESQSDAPQTLVSHDRNDRFNRVDNVNNIGTESTRSGFKTNYWLIGSLATAAAIVVGGAGFLILSMQGWQQAQEAVDKATTLRDEKKFPECVSAVADFVDSNNQAREISNECYLSTAKDLAKAGKIRQAIQEAKEVKSGSNSKTYDEAKTLIANWSKGREIRINNNCSHPVRVLLRFIDPKNNLATKVDGWWSLAAGDNSYLSDQGQRIRVLDPIYYFAESTDGSGWVWEGEESVTFKDQTYKMRALDAALDSDGNFVRGLTCGES